MSEFHINIPAGQKKRLLTGGRYCPNNILVAASISSASAAVSEKDINFYDFDGTCLYSYTLDDIQTLTQIPPLPNHAGLICQGWNWTLEEIKSNGGPVNVGAMYITDDGKTRLHIKIPTDARMDVPLYFYQSESNGATINWGDNSADESLSETGFVNTNHAYAAPGEYIITLTPVNGAKIGLGNNTTTNCVLGRTANHAVCSMLQRVELGAVTGEIFTGTFYNCHNLKSIAIPDGISNFHSRAFWWGNSLLHITVPKSVKQLRGYLIYCCYSIKSISLPASIAVIADGDLSFCHAITKIFLPSGLQTLGYGVFQSDVSLTKLIFPPALTSIAGNAFYGNSGTKVYDFTRCAVVPTLAAASAFTDIASDCEIWIPSALYDEWISATNWAMYADHIIAKEGTV